MRSGSESKQTDIDSIRVAFLLFARPATTCQWRDGQGSAIGSFSRHSTDEMEGGTEPDSIPCTTTKTGSKRQRRSPESIEISRDTDLVSQNSFTSALFVDLLQAGCYPTLWLHPAYWLVIPTILVINSLYQRRRKTSDSLLELRFALHLTRN